MSYKMEELEIMLSPMLNNMTGDQRMCIGKFLMKLGEDVGHDKVGDRFSRMKLRNAFYKVFRESVEN